MYRHGKHLLPPHFYPAATFLFSLSFFAEKTCFGSGRSLLCHDGVDDFNIGAAHSPKLVSGGNILGLTIRKLYTQQVVTAYEPHGQYIVELSGGSNFSSFTIYPRAGTFIMIKPDYYEQAVMVFPCGDDRVAISNRFANRSHSRVESIWVAPQSGPVGFDTTVRLDSINTGKNSEIGFLTIVGPRNNLLRALRVNNGLMMPDFDPNTCTYTVVVAHESTTLNVTAQARDISARIIINGTEASPTVTIELADLNSTKISVVVILEMDPDDSKIYTMVVSRAPPDPFAMEISPSVFLTNQLGTLDLLGQWLNSARYLMLSLVPFPFGCENVDEGVIGSVTLNRPVPVTGTGGRAARAVANFSINISTQAWACFSFCPTYLTSDTCEQNRRYSKIGVEPIYLRGYPTLKRANESLGTSLNTVNVEGENLVFKSETNKTSAEVSITNTIQSVQLLFLNDTLMQVKFRCNRTNRGPVLLRVTVDGLSSSWKLIGTIQPPPEVARQTVRVSSTYNQLHIHGRNFDVSGNFYVSLYIKRGGFVAATSLIPITLSISPKRALIAVSGISEETFGPLYAMVSAYGAYSEAPVQIATIGQPFVEHFLAFATDAHNTSCAVARFQVTRRYLDTQNYELDLLYKVEWKGRALSLNNFSLVSTGGGEIICLVAEISSFDTMMHGKCKPFSTAHHEEMNDGRVHVRLFSRIPQVITLTGRVGLASELQGALTQPHLESILWRPEQTSSLVGVAYLMKSSNGYKVWAKLTRSLTESERDEIDLFIGYESISVSLAEPSSDDVYYGTFETSSHVELGDVFRISGLSEGDIVGAVRSAQRLFETNSKLAPGAFRTTLDGTALYHFKVINDNVYNPAVRSRLVFGGIPDVTPLIHVLGPSGEIHGRVEKNSFGSMGLLSPISWSENISLELEYLNGKTERLTLIENWDVLVSDYVQTRWAAMLQNIPPGSCSGFLRLEGGQTHSYYSFEPESDCQISGTMSISGMSLPFFDGGSSHNIHTGMIEKSASTDFFTLDSGVSVMWNNNGTNLSVGMLENVNSASIFSGTHDDGVLYALVRSVTTTTTTLVVNARLIPAGNSLHYVVNIAGEIVPESSCELEISGERYNVDLDSGSTVIGSVFVKNLASVIVPHDIALVVLKQGIDVTRGKFRTAPKQYEGSFSADSVGGHVLCEVENAAMMCSVREVSLILSASQLDITDEITLEYCGVGHRFRMLYSFMQDGRKVDMYNISIALSTLNSLFCLDNMSVSINRDGLIATADLVQSKEAKLSIIRDRSSEQLVPLGIFSLAPRGSISGGGINGVVRSWLDFQEPALHYSISLKFHGAPTSTESNSTRIAKDVLESTGVYFKNEIDALSLSNFPQILGGRGKLPLTNSEMTKFVASKMLEFRVKPYADLAHFSIGLNDDPLYFFSSSFKHGYVPNSTLPEHVIGFNGATETTAYKSGRLTFAIFSPTGHFGINETKGDIFLKRILEMKSNIFIFSLRVSVTDVISGYREDHTVRLKSCVENVGPYFAEQNISVTVSEASVIGTVVLRTSAHDENMDGHYCSTELESLTYNISAPSFSILPFSLVTATDFSEVYLVLKTKLDFELRNNYSFSLGVQDSMGLRASVPVEVVVVNENDNSPIFSKGPFWSPVCSGPPEQSLSVLESAPKGLKIIQLGASDLDGLDSLSFAISTGPISCPSLSEDSSPKSITGTDGMFRIDPTDGSVFLSGKLDYESASRYNVFVYCTDGAKTSVVNLSVAVIDVDIGLEFIPGGAVHGTCTDASFFSAENVSIGIRLNDEILAGHAALSCRHIASDDMVPCGILTAENPEILYTMTSLSEKRYNLSVKADFYESVGGQEALLRSSYFNFVFVVDKHPPAVSAEFKSEPTPTLSLSVIDSCLANGFNGCITITCLLDDAQNFSSCGTAKQVRVLPNSSLLTDFEWGGLSDGLHVVQVIVVDAAGNKFPNPISYSWKMDTRPPLMGIKSLTRSNSQVYRFSVLSDEFPISSINCSSDQASISCSRSGKVDIMAPGSLDLSISGSDVAGNIASTINVRMDSGRVLPSDPSSTTLRFASKIKERFAVGVSSASNWTVHLAAGEDIGNISCRMRSRRLSGVEEEAHDACCRSTFLSGVTCLEQCRSFKPVSFGCLVRSEGTVNLEDYDMCLSRSLGTSVNDSKVVFDDTLWGLINGPFEPCAFPLELHAAGSTTGFQPGFWYGFEVSAVMTGGKRVDVRTTWLSVPDMDRLSVADEAPETSPSSSCSSNGGANSIFVLGWVLVGVLIAIIVIYRKKFSLRISKVIQSEVKSKGKDIDSDTLAKIRASAREAMARFDNLEELPEEYDEEYDENDTSEEYDEDEEEESREGKGEEIWGAGEEQRPETFGFLDEDLDDYSLHDGSEEPDMLVSLEKRLVDLREKLKNTERQSLTMSILGTRVNEIQIEIADLEEQIRISRGDDDFFSEENFY